MKVIMIKDVGGVGRRDEVKDVSDGFAMNSLIPQGKAVQATPERIAELTKKQSADATHHATQDERAKQDAKTIADGSIIIAAKCNEQRHLYKQISRETIAEAIAQEKNVTVDPHHIEPLEHIKTLGDFEVIVNLHGHKATVKLLVIQAEV